MPNGYTRTSGHSILGLAVFDRSVLHAEATSPGSACTDSLTDKDITDIRQNLECSTPWGAPGEVIMDGKDGRLVGVEVLEASGLRHGDLPAAAERIDEYLTG